MKSVLVPARSVREPDLVRQALSALDAAWSQGDFTVDGFAKLVERDQGSPSLVARLIKADLNHRYVGGQKTEVTEYLDRFPWLADYKDRMVSLLYEEFCLREEYGEPQDPSIFCARYPTWSDSIRSQIRYHRVISQAVGQVSPRPRYPEVGEYFGRFELARNLGEGGAARVYLAFDDDLGGKPFVLKISADVGDEPSIMGRLSHVNIVPVIWVDTETETGLRGLAMPYFAGRPLDQALKLIDPSKPSTRAMALWQVIAPKAKPGGSPAEISPPWPDFPANQSYAHGVVWLIRALALALEHAHRRDIQHGDVKPANILLTVDDGPKLLDFNLARSPDIVDSAHLGGTLPYMAPEQLRAFLDPERWSEVGAQADIYSLGLVMTELLTGERPGIDEAFEKLPRPRAINALLFARGLPRRSLRSVNPSVPHALDAIAERCLAFDPTERYRTAADLAEDLDGFLERKPLTHTTNPSRTERSANWLIRNRLTLLVVSLVLSTLAICVYSFDLGQVATSWVVPIVQRKEMTQVVDYLDAQKLAEARSELIRLEGLYPQSVLPPIYLASTLIAAKSSTPALLVRILQKVIEAPDRFDQVRAWKAHDSDLARRLSVLSRLLVEKTQATNDEVNRVAWGLAELANSIDQQDSQALGILGSRSLLRGEFEASQGFFDQAIRFAITAPERANLCQSRARLFIRWGEQIINEGRVDAPADAASRFSAALEDLEDFRSLKRERDRRSTYSYQVMIGRAALGMAKALTRDPSASDIRSRTFLDRAEDEISAAVKFETEDLRDSGMQDASNLLTEIRKLRGVSLGLTP